METTKKTIKATGKSQSGLTYYFDIPVPAGVVTVKEGLFCGTHCNPEASIEEISWAYNFGKKHFSITNNGKNQTKDFAETILKYYEIAQNI